VVTALPATRRRPVAEDGALRGRAGARRWLAAEDGVSTVEYGILAAAVGVGLVAVGPALAEAFLALLEMITGGFSQ
jgi:Flp pilus assembly pilin Flp